MSKWKKSGKRLLVLLLAAAVIGGMLDFSQVTVTAADGENQEAVTSNADEGDVTPSEEAIPEEAEPEPEKTPEEAIPETEKTPEEADPGPEKTPEEADPEPEKTPEEAEPEPEKTPEEADPEPETSPEETPKKQEPSNTEGDVPVLPELTCTCEVRCAEETVQTDCLVCAEDLTGCTGAAVPEDEEPDAGNLDEVIPEGEVLDTENPDEDIPKEDDQAAAAVKELIEKLPSLEELKDLDEDGQREAYDQIQAAFDAYEELTEEQKAQLPDAEELFRELLEYFTELTALAAADIQGAWDAMTAAMENWEPSVDLSSYNITEADYEEHIWPGVAEDNPDLFYMLMATYYMNSQKVIQRVDFTYSPEYNQTHVAAYKAAVQKVLDEVIRSNGSMTDEQKALALHDYLIQHMEYDQRAFDNSGLEKRNAYEALVNGIGVCQGYTLAYAALLKEVGIEVGFCRSKGMNHIWNYVKLNGNWYHVDLTYDDITASTVGETGAVKHKYFLLSDNAMGADHNWDSNNITCSDTRYDNDWRKTAPIEMSAIYTVNGAEYYLEGGTIPAGSINAYVNTALMKRASDGTVTEIARINMENGWVLINQCLSRLSCSKGILYFNVGNSVYSYNPSIPNAAPAEIYKYSDGTRIVTGLLVTGDEMILESSERNFADGDKITLPLFTVKASEQNLKAGYTTPPVLTATSQASSFVWAKKLSDGSFQTISGASGSTYTVETGLAAGTYTYRVTASLNGKTVEAYVTITVTAQEEQKNFGFTESKKTVTYGDADFTVTAQGAEAGSSVTYSSSDSSVAAVDRTTGAVQILKAGTAVITAEASETADYLKATSTYNLTVVPKALTWDTSALEARDRLDQIKDRAATLYGELKLAGILEKDASAVQFSCPSGKLTGVYETAAEGSQKVFLSWKDAQDTAVLQGNGAGNYTMPAALPEITGRISVNTSILIPSDDETSDTKLMVNVENGISEVPETFKDKEHLNTPGKIEKEMRVTLQGKYSEIQEDRIVVYDVELLIQVDGTWRKATVEEFPSGGLTLTLPYPSGTGKDTHDFVVTHMFTKDMNGFRVGDVEYPSVSKTNEGLTFKVYGLSPISVGWKDVQRSSSSSGTRRDESTAAAPVSVVSNVNSAPTGDSSQAAPYIFLALVSLGVLAEMYTRRKKINR